MYLLMAVEIASVRRQEAVRKLGADQNQLELNKVCWTHNDMLSIISYFAWRVRKMCTVTIS